MRALLLALVLAVIVACGDSSNPWVPPDQTTTAEVPSASLKWDANHESDLAGYNIYRGLTTGLPLKDYSTFVKIGTVTTTSFTDNTGIPGTTYYYVVTAFDTANPYNESEQSNEVSKTF
jgi:fibronectin type 3 domain-containing protein